MAGVGMTNAEQLRKYREGAVAAGLCQECRCRPQKSGCVSCVECMDKRKERRSAYVFVGLCRCGKDPIDGISVCEQCRNNRVARDKRARTQLKDRGLCTTCRSSPAESGHTLCAEHLLRSRERARVTRIAKLKAGLCAASGCQDRLYADHTMCAGHLLQMRARRPDRKRSSRV